MLGNNVVDSREAVGRGVTAYALIVDAVLETVLIEKILQVVGIASPGDTGSQTITKRDDDRPSIGGGWGSGGGCGGTWLGRGALFWLWRFRGTMTRACESPEQARCQNERRLP